MTFDLQQLRELVLLSSQPDKGVVAIPKDFRLASLEQFSDIPRRQRGTFETSSIQTFESFLNRELENTNQEPVIFISNKEPVMMATAYLHFGTGQKPSWRDYVAICTPLKTPVHEKLDVMTSGLNSQESFLELLEDFGHEIEFFVDNGDKSRKLSIDQTYVEFRDLTLQKLAETKSRRSNVSHERSSMEKLEMRSTIPTRLTIDAPRHFEFPQQTRSFRISPTEHHGSIAFGLREIGAGQADFIERKMFIQMLTGAFADEDRVDIYLGDWDEGGA